MPVSPRCPRARRCTCALLAISLTLWGCPNGTGPDPLVWTAQTSLPEARRAGHLNAVGTDLYYFGGNASIFTDYVASAYLFDASSQTWTGADSMPTARDQGATAVAAGRICGVNPLAPEHNGFSRLSVNEAFNVATGTWATAAEIPTARGSVRADTLGGLIYVVGGSTGPEALSTVEVYDPATDSWSTAPPLPAPRLNHTLASIHGKLHVAGGEGPDRDARAEVFEFNPATGDWSARGAAMPTPRLRAGSAVLDGKLVVLGGQLEAGGAFSDAVEVYVPTTGLWSSLPSLPMPMIDVTAVAVGRTLYVVGGLTPDSVTSRVFSIFVP